MAIRDPETALTYRHYLQLPEGLRYEILEGDLYSMTPAPSPYHQRISSRLQIALDEFVEKRDLGLVFNAPIDVVLSDFNVLQPDLIYIAKPRLGIIKKTGIFGSPDLVIEILSPSTVARDREIKKAVYERFSVQEFWLVDPETKNLELFSLQEGRFMLRSTFGLKDTLCSELLPEFELALVDVFRGW